MNVQVIEDEIIKLEHSDTTWQNCEKLASLYIVRDHLKEPPERETLSVSYETVSRVGGSEFLDACSAAPDIAEVLYILDEHMTVIEALYPREYSAIINKIQGL